MVPQQQRCSRCHYRYDLLIDFPLSRMMDVGLRLTLLVGEPSQNTSLGRTTAQMFWQLPRRKHALHAAKMCANCDGVQSVHLISRCQQCGREVEFAITDRTELASVLSEAILALAGNVKHNVLVKRLKQAQADVVWSMGELDNGEC